jgi:hypothetical protein
MRHIAFYYAIGFAVAGVLMLTFTVITLASYTLDPLNTAALTMAIVLPFLVSMLSWREWANSEDNKHKQEE